MRIRLKNKNIFKDNGKYYLDISFWSIFKIIILANLLLLFLEMVLIIIGSNARVI